MGLLDRAMERLRQQEPGASGTSPEEAAPASEPPPRVPPRPVRSGRGYELVAPTFDLDAAGLAERGFLVPGQPMDPPLLEEYRRLKRALLFRVSAPVQGEDVDPVVAERRNMLLVTSAKDGEGKTFVSSNLAFSIAMEVDRSALLVDGDIIRRGATRLLGLEDRPGLMDVLAGTVEDLAEVIVRPEGIPNLSVLPAGRPHEKINELMASQRTDELMAEIATRYADRVIVVDSPPMLLASETAVLARLVGQVVLVVQADRTPQHLVEQALGHVEAERFSGVVLNRASRKIGSGGGYGEYYSGE